MTSSTFYIHGPEAGSNDTYVEATLSGVDFDGTVQLDVTGGGTVTLTPDELSELRQEDLIVSGTAVANAPQSLIDAIQALQLETDGQTYDNDVEAHLNNTKKELFRAVSKSAE
jgi:hypothetical protein